MALSLAKQHRMTLLEGIEGLLLLSYRKQGKLKHKEFMTSYPNMLRIRYKIKTLWMHPRAFKMR